MKIKEKHILKCCEACCSHLEVMEKPDNLVGFFLKNIFIYLFGSARLGLVGSSSLTRDQTHIPYIGNTVSYPLDHLEVPQNCVLNS